MRDLFRDDPDRFERYTLKLDDLLIDASKKRINDAKLSLLENPARAVELEGWRDQMFAGKKINAALRNRANRPIMVDGQDVMPAANAVLDQIRGFTERVRSGACP